MLRKQADETVALLSFICEKKCAIQELSPTTGKRANAIFTVKKEYKEPKNR